MKQTGNSKYLKRLNRMLVLNLIKANEPVSRQQLTELTGLTSAAMTGIIRELLDLGFVEECGLGTSQGGRKPVTLRFNAGAGRAIGIEITRNETTIAVSDLKNYPNILTTHKLDMKDPQKGIPQLVECVQEIRETVERDEQKVLGIGVAFPGFLNSNEGVIHRAINLGPKWKGFSLKSVMRKEIQLPVFVEINSKAAALAEKWFGEGQFFDDLIYVNWGEGISAGILQDCSVFHGSQGYAGQIGHVVLDENGPLCNCGNRGCIEAVCGIPALERKANTEVPLLDDDPLKVLWEQAGVATFQDILSCQKKDETSYSAYLLKHAAHSLGTGIADMVNFYNPEAVFIGGRAAKAGEAILDVIKQTVRTNAFPEVAQTAKIMLSKLGGDAGAIGACALVLQNLLVSSDSTLLDEKD